MIKYVLWWTVLFDEVSKHNFTSRRNDCRNIKKVGASITEYISHNLQRFLYFLLLLQDHFLSSAEISIIITHFYKRAQWKRNILQNSKNKKNKIRKRKFNKHETAFLFKLLDYKRNMKIFMKRFRFIILVG